MNSASQVRISKIKVKKDKAGLKWATVQLTRAVAEEDSYTSGVRATIEHMRENKVVTNVKLSERVERKNLVFFAAEGLDKESEMFPVVDLVNFRIRREDEEERDWLVLSFEFTIQLDDAKRWIIPSIGDDILCVVEDSQLSFPQEGI
jgi:hypothetical protein